MENGLLKRAHRCLILGLTMGVLTLSGCGGGGASAGSATLSASPLSTRILVQDANIVGAKVQDKSGALGTYLGNGYYEFIVGHTVVFPVSVRSQNSPATIASCMPNSAVTCNVANIKTFQDLDNSGTWTAGDVIYNGSMDIQYAPQSGSGAIIYANPIVALIPSSGVPTAKLGLTAAQISTAATANFTTAPAAVKALGSQLAALQEVLVNVGADPAAVSLLLTNISTSSATTLTAAVQQAVNAIPPTTLFPAPAVAPAAADMYTAVGNIATAITGAMATSASTHYEAIVTVVQGAIPIKLSTQTSAQVMARLAAASPTTTPFNSITQTTYDAASTAIQAAINLQNQFVANVNGSFIMPIYDIYTKAVLGGTTTLDGLTKFSLTYNADHTITINGVNLAGAPAIAGKTLTFDAGAQMYGFADPVSKLYIAISFNASSLNGAKVLTYCNDYAGVTTTVPVCSLHYFALPTQADVCRFQFADGTFFADQTVAGVRVAGHGDYAVGGRFTTMNLNKSFCK